MGDGLFRMAFKGQSFLSISIDMSVDIRLWTAEDGTIQCRSVGYSVDDMAKLLGQVRQAAQPFTRRHPHSIIHHS